MDNSQRNQWPIFDLYRRFCEIRSREEGYKQEKEAQLSKISREQLVQLKSEEVKLHRGRPIFDELYKLMKYLNLTVHCSEFSCFYDFVFFVCREDGQKNIAVAMAVTAWRLILPGRFRLFNQWCDFVEKTQRHNISEDTWQQVLAFSWCVHENLEGYDPEGAWPVLIDDFVQHMYRLSGSNENYKFNESLEDPLPGLNIFPGLKRKLPENPCKEEKESTNCSLDPMEFSPVRSSKRIQQPEHKAVNKDYKDYSHRHTNSSCTVEGAYQRVSQVSYLDILI